MTITDTFLEELAKALSSESYSVPTHNVVATTVVTTIDITDTTLSGIIGTADSVTNVRDTNVVTFTALRSGTSVVDTIAGDYLASAGLFTAASGGTLLTGVTLTELHTTSFDIQFDWELNINRS